jgi:hypothetical protein
MAGIATFIQKTRIRARPSADGDWSFNQTSPGVCRGVCPTDVDAEDRRGPPALGWMRSPCLTILWRAEDFGLANLKVGTWFEKFREKK